MVIQLWQNAIDAFVQEGIATKRDERTKQLYDAAQTVTYKNTQSNLGTLEFTGILDYSPSSYTKGGSLMVPVTVTITEAIDGSVYDASQDEEESEEEGDT